ncbi:MAG: sensor histidine kinase [Bacteroidales bacterium]
MKIPESIGNSDINPKVAGGYYDKPQVNDDSVYFRIIENAGGVPYQITFQPSPDGGSCVNIGEEITGLLGIVPDEFCEERYREMVEKIVPLCENMPEDITEARKKLFSGEIKSFRARLLFRTSEGRRKWIYETASPVTDTVTGVIKGVAGVLFDENKWQKLLNIPQNIIKNPEESDLLKVAFLRNISHEIRTPLNAIIGFSTILGDSSCDSVMRKEYTDIILRCADQLLETLDNIVEASLLEAKEVKIKKENANVNSIIREVFERLKNKAAAKNVKFSYRIPVSDEDMIINTDRFKVLKILLNLTENAIKFTNTGEVEFGYAISAGMVEFYVYDTGNGIPEECRNHIFDNFFQADSGPTRLHGGTGLGLSISKGYVELLGGKIWFFSEPGAGTTFYFTIPYEKTVNNLNE